MKKTSLAQADHHRTTEPQPPIELTPVGKPVQSAGGHKIHLFQVRVKKGKGGLSVSGIFTDKLGDYSECPEGDFNEVAAQQILENPRSMKGVDYIIPMRNTPRTVIVAPSNPKHYQHVDLHKLILFGVCPTKIIIVTGEKKKKVASKQRRPRASSAARVSVKKTATSSRQLSLTTQ